MDLLSELQGEMVKSNYSEVTINLSQLLIKGFLNKL
jgi:hypothetical protein